MKGLIIMDFFRTLYNPDTKSLFEGVRDFLEEYSKIYTLAIVGKGDEKRTSLINDLNIKKYFKYIKLKTEKEESDFIDCLKELKFNKEYTWSVGDRIKKEIFLSNKLGLKTVWFRNGKFALEGPIKKEEEACFTIASFEDLKKIIPL